MNIRDDYNGDKTIIEIIQFNKAFKSIIILMIIIIDKAIFEVIGDLISGNFNSMKNKKGQNISDPTYTYLFEGFNF